MAGKRDEVWARLRAPAASAGADVRDADRPVWLAALVFIQALAAVFLAGDALGEQRWSAHVAAQAMIAAGLAAATVLTALELRRVLAAARSGAARATASGAMAELIRLRCAEWRLTPAEAEIALLAIKGLGPDEIARLRGVPHGDVRAQLTRICAKAGVNGRAGLASLLIEDLLVAPPCPVIDAPQPAIPASPAGRGPAPRA